MNRKSLFALALSLLLVFSIVLPAGAAEKKAGLGTLEEILNYVNGSYVDKPDQDAMIRGAIDGALDTLNDPYTYYLPPEELKEFSGSINGDYVGIGVRLEQGDTYPRIMEVFENSPAISKGLKPGDLILKVDGADLAGDKLTQVVDKIRGPEGTKVRLLIRREGEKDFELEVERESVSAPTVEWKVLEDGTGQINLLTFGSHTAGEFSNSLKALKDKGVTNVIIDLRDCPGGILNAAVKIAGNFLEPGQVVTSVINRSGKRETYRATGEPMGKGLKLAVLVNKNSASAAEILAGALQDYGRAVLIGGQTYGKGSVQAVLPLDSGGALKLTVAKYLTGKGRAINGIGLEPEIKVQTPSLQLIAAREYFHPVEKRKVVFDPGKAWAKVDGTQVKAVNFPIRRGGVTLLPLRFTLEALGYSVNWQAQDGSVKVYGAEKDVLFNPASGKTIVNGQEMAFPPVTFEGGVAYMPAPYLEFFGARMTEDANGTCIEK
ncbi:MAG: S41 family peptidase [Eubacteriales bacterium]